MLAISLITLTLHLSISSAHASPKRLPRAESDIIRSCTVDNVVALTFDDGPSDYMEDVVNKIKAVGGKATFFLNGANGHDIHTDPYPAHVKYAYDSGFQIGSHTWAHKDLSTLGHDEINNQMSLSEEAIHNIIGVTPAFTRPPFGNTNEVVVQVAKERRQTLVNWDFDSGDSLNSPVETQKAAYDTLVSQHPRSVLSLQHDTIQSSSTDVLPYAISKLTAAGYKFVTVAECLGMPAYLDAPQASSGAPGGGAPSGQAGASGEKETWKKHRRAMQRVMMH